MIAAFFTLNMVLSLKGFLQVFDHIIAMTNGGPGTATESISVLIYRGGFQGGEYGYQFANAVIFMIVIVVFAIVQLRVLRRREMEARCRRRTFPRPRSGAPLPRGGHARRRAGGSRRTATRSTGG